MTQPTILVTGGAGYIGSHACKALAAAGYTPVTFDNLVYGHADLVKWGPLERGDLLDGERIRQVIAHYRPQAVMHFAAYAYVGESVTEPAKYYRNNVVGTLNLLDAMRESGVGRLVFSSTCATYGEPQQIPISESHPQQPINPYGTTKLMIEQVLRDYSQAYGLRAIALRYFNAAGADPQGECGEDHTPETHLIPLVLEVAAGRRSRITVFGDDYPTPDGTCIRDYIHVTDLATAHLQALAYLEQQSGFHPFNLGNGRGFSVNEVIACAEQVTGQKIAVEIGARRPGDPPQLIGDANAAIRQLGWHQALGELPQIIESAWAWHQRRWGERNRP